MFDIGINPQDIDINPIVKQMHLQKRCMRASNAHVSASFLCNCIQHCLWQVWDSATQCSPVGARLQPIHKRQTRAGAI